MIAKVSRRGLIAGLAVAPLVLNPAHAAEAGRWIAYERRLRARLRDAAGGRFDAAMARDLLTRNNAFRREQGRGVLRWDDDLAAAARAHAADMADRDFFAHRTIERFDGGARVAILARTLLGASGENLAYRLDTKDPPTPAQFTKQWRDSPGHRENMLRASFDHAGFGVLRRGAHAWAVGMFAGVDARLASPLPWRLEARDDIEKLLTGAAPAIGRYAISEPLVEQAYDVVQVGGGGRELPRGASQLRPLRQTSERRFDVLWGPVFLV
jgi:uncharacterized protein YkwD